MKFSHSYAFFSTFITKMQKGILNKNFFKEEFFMKMRKILSITIVLALAVGMLAGCAGGGSQASSADISAFVDTDETLAITWLSNPVMEGSNPDTAPELLIEDRFNVDITPIFTSYSKHNDQKNALLQSDDIPDLIYEMDPMYHFADARDEYLLEVPYAAIEKYAPTLYKQINELAPAAWAYSYYDGKNTGLPNLNHSHVQGTVSIYRADWLEKVGMEVPTTIDELHDVLYAFVHNDPDGNGKDDTYGFVPTSTSTAYYFPEFFGAYNNVLPFDWQEVDGEIVYGGLRPETEEVLQLLADWYKDGIIYPAFIELDKSASALFKLAKTGYYTCGGYQDETSTTSIISVTRQNDPKATVAYGPIVKGPDGDSGVRGWGYPAHTVAFGDRDETSPVKATRLLKMFETMVTDDELLKEIRIGKEGETFEYKDPSVKSSSIYAPTENYKATSQRKLAGYEFSFAGAQYWSPIAPSKELYESMFSPAYLEWCAEWSKPEVMLHDVFYKVDIIPSAPTYLVDMQNAQQALMAKIIKGEIPADQYIEEFTKIWEGTGGPTMLEEAKAQQDIVKEIYKQVGIN